MLRLITFQDKEFGMNIDYKMLITESSIDWAQIKAKYPILKTYRMARDFRIDDVIPELPPSLLNVLYGADSAPDTKAVDELTVDFDKKTGEASLRIRELESKNKELESINSNLKISNAQLSEFNAKASDPLVEQKIKRLEALTSEEGALIKRNLELLQQVQAFEQTTRENEIVIVTLKDEVEELKKQIENLVPKEESSEGG